MHAIDEANRRAPHIRTALLSWAKKGLRNYPWRTNRTPYSILVAEFLLKRTTALAASRIFERFVKEYPGISTLATASDSGLKKILIAIGYHKLRAREMKKTAMYIMNRFKGEIPRDMKKLLSIPNVGPYTAGAILSLGYGIPASMVDSNVERIVKRVFIDSLPCHLVSRIVKEIADTLSPAEDHDIFNLALLDLGGSICTYRIAYCEKCPISLYCDTGRKKSGSKSVTS
jgi:A/G-specific adenine glycosylase